MGEKERRAWLKSFRKVFPQARLVRDPQQLALESSRRSSDALSYRAPVTASVTPAKRQKTDTRQKEFL